jgi:hypothetical protein
MPKANEPERNRTLTAKMERVAVCLASGKTLAEACQLCKVGRTTVWEWMRQPAFKERVAELRKQLTDVALGQLTALLTDAARGLSDILKAADTPARMKLDTIRTIFETYIGMMNNAELRAEIDRIKASLPGAR